MIWSRRRGWPTAEAAYDASAEVTGRPVRRLLGGAWLSASERRAITAPAAQSTTRPAVQRAQVLLHAADGVSNTDIAVLAGVTRMTVRAWRAEFAEQGLADLGKVAAGRGRKASIPQSVVDEIVELTLHSRPEGATHCWAMCLCLRSREACRPP